MDETLTTEYRSRKTALVKEIQEDFKQLMTSPDAMKTMAYRSLARKYRLTERTIQNYLKS